MRRFASTAAIAGALLMAACSSSPSSALPPARSANLSGSGSLQMLNGSDGWTYGNDLVGRTTDGGHTFENVTPPGAGGEKQFVYPYFLDSEHAWIWLVEWNQSVLASATLERTSNGGTSWTAMLFERHVAGGTAFIDARHGWMTTGRQLADNAEVEDTLWRTTDGGRSWASVFVSTYRLDIQPSIQRGGCHWLGDVAWTTTTHGLAGVSCPFDTPPAVEVTDDGGSTWRAVRLPNLPAREGIALFNSVTQIHSFGGGRLAASVSRCVGSDGSSCYPYGSLYRSADGGLTWTPGAVVERGGGLFMPDADHAWMPDACVTTECDGTDLISTSDAGAHWQSLPLPRALWPNLHGSRNYSVVTPLTAYVVATNAMAGTADYYETIDGGRTFNKFEPRFVAGPGGAKPPG